MLSGSRTRAERLAKDLSEEGLNAFYSQDMDRISQSRGDHGCLWSRKTWLPVSANQICSDDRKPIFWAKGRGSVTRKKMYSGNRIQDFAELSIGDLVVHEKHGLGIYRGIEKVEVDRVVKDYIKIEYRGGSESLYPGNPAGCFAEIFRILRKCKNA